MLDQKTILSGDKIRIKDKVSREGLGDDLPYVRLMFEPGELRYVIPGVPGDTFTVLGIAKYGSIECIKLRSEDGRPFYVYWREARVNFEMA